IYHQYSNQYKMSPIALVFSIHLFFLIVSLVERAQKSPFPFFDLLTLVLQPQSLTSCLFVHRCISSKPSPCTYFLSYFYSLYTKLREKTPNQGAVSARCSNFTYTFVFPIFVSNTSLFIHCF